MIHYMSLVPGGSCVVSSQSRHCYHTLRSSRSQINTFCTHPWVFICNSTGERLCANKKEVFLPEAWFKFINRADNGLVSVGRQEVKIHLPLKTLRDLCLWRLTFLVQSKEDFYHLEIPKSLRDDLIHVFDQSAKHSEDEREAESGRHSVEQCPSCSPGGRKSDNWDSNQSAIVKTPNCPEIRPKVGQSKSISVPMVTSR